MKFICIIGLLATLSLFLGQANGQVYALQPFLVGEYDFFNASIWRSDAPYLGVPAPNGFQKIELVADASCSPSPSPCLVLKLDQDLKVSTLLIAGPISLLMPPRPDSTAATAMIYVLDALRFHSGYIYGGSLATDPNAIGADVDYEEPSLSETPPHATLGGGIMVFVSSRITIDANRPVIMQNATQVVVQGGNGKIDIIRAPDGATSTFIGIEPGSAVAPDVLPSIKFEALSKFGCLNTDDGSSTGLLTTSIRAVVEHRGSAFVVGNTLIPATACSLILGFDDIPAATPAFNDFTGPVEVTTTSSLTFLATSVTFGSNSVQAKAGSAFQFGSPLTFTEVNHAALSLPDSTVTLYGNWKWIESTSASTSTLGTLNWIAGSITSAIGALHTLELKYGGVIAVQDSAAMTFTSGPPPIGVDPFKREVTGALNLLANSNLSVESELYLVNSIIVNTAATITFAQGKTGRLLPSGANSQLVVASGGIIRAGVPAESTTHLIDLHVFTLSSGATLSTFNTPATTKRDILRIATADNSATLNMETSSTIQLTVNTETNTSFSDLILSTTNNQLYTQLNSNGRVTIAGNTHLHTGSTVLRNINMSGNVYVGHAAGLTIQNAVLNSVKIAAWAANTPVNFRGTLKFIGSAPIELSGIVATINSTAIAWETPLLFSDTSLSIQRPTVLGLATATPFHQSSTNGTFVIGSGASVEILQRSTSFAANVSLQLEGTLAVKSTSNLRDIVEFLAPVKAAANSVISMQSRGGASINDTDIIWPSSGHSLIFANDAELHNTFVITPPTSQSFLIGSHVLGLVQAGASSSFIGNYTTSIAQYGALAFPALSAQVAGETLFGFTFPNVPIAPPPEEPIAEPEPSESSGEPSQDVVAAWLPAAIAVPIVVVVAVVVFIIILIVVRRRRAAAGGEAKTGEPTTDVEMAAPKNDNYVSISGPNSPRGGRSGGLEASTGGQYAALDPTSGMDEERLRRTQSAVYMKKKRNWEIPFEQLKFQKELGSGAFGSVWKGKWFDTDVAIKQSLLVSTTSTSQADFETEAKLMTKLRPHPNVCQILGISVNENRMLLVMEYCRRGSLSDYWGKDSIDMDKKLKIISGVASGIRHLHSNMIVHRDIAARNILLTSDWNGKVSDFGMSRIITEADQSGKTTSSTGPLRWMAPESIKNKEYSFATDAWSFGIFCYEVLDEKEPHEKLDVLDAGVKIRDTNLTPTLPKGTPAFLAKVIESCWNTDPNARPTFDQIVQELGDHILDESSEGGHDEGEAGEERSSSNKNTSSNTTTNTSS